MYPSKEESKSLTNLESYPLIHLWPLPPFFSFILRLGVKVCLETVMTILPLSLECCFYLQYYLASHDISALVI